MELLFAPNVADNEHLAKRPKAARLRDTLTLRRLGGFLRMAKIAPKVAKASKDCTEIAPKFVVYWNAVKYTIREVDGVWKLQSRRKEEEIFHTFGPGRPKDIENAFYDFMRAGGSKGKKHKRYENKTLADLLEVYESIPKRASKDTARGNVLQMENIAREVFKAEPVNIKYWSITPKTWATFMALKQGGTLDLNTRRRENVSINSSVRQAASVFIKRLRPQYAERGFTLDDDVTNIQWLPEPYVPPAAARDKDLIKEWSKLKEEKKPLWFAIGLARFAGLRRGEIEGARPSWLVRVKGVPYMQLMDREEDEHFTKTGMPYLAIILNEELAAEIEALPRDEYIVTPSADRFWWIERKPSAWARKFAPKAPKPLHRLRGLYLDQVREEQEEAIATRKEAIKKASEAAGHTTTNTTEDHYLTPDALKV